jgi:hypothetical protein
MEGSGFVDRALCTTLVCVKYFILMRLQQISSKISLFG